jgi:hypothetical protein
MTLKIFPEKTKDLPKTAPASKVAKDEGTFVKNKVS